jgi:hypothetical protein
MSERRWTTAFLALLGMILLEEASIRNSFGGLLFTSVSPNQAPSMLQSVAYFVTLIACFAACLLFMRYREDWWRYFQGRKIAEGPIGAAALARCTLLVLGAWLIFDPFLQLLVEIRDWLPTPPAAPYEFAADYTSHVSWITHGSSMAMGLLVSILSCPLAAWFARTQTTHPTPPETTPLAPDRQ